MATLDFIPVPAQTPSTKISALAPSTSTVEQALGAYQIFQINADQDITIRFGVPGFSASAAATDYRIPAGVPITFDVGKQYTSFKCFNLGGAAANIYILFISKF